MAEPSRRNSSCPRCAVWERRVAELEAQNAKREAEIAPLKARIAELEELLLEATHAAKRQAAPFPRNKPTAGSKKPGRAEDIHRPIAPPRDHSRSPKRSGFGSIGAPRGGINSRIGRRTSKSSRTHPGWKR